MSLQHLRPLTEGDYVEIGNNKYYTIIIIKKGEIYVSNVDDTKEIWKLILYKNRWMVENNPTHQIRFLSKGEYNSNKSIPKLIVIGGGGVNDEIYNKIDPNFITIGSHRGPLENMNWDDPSYWNDAIALLEDFYNKICCIIIDGGSESWLNKTDIDGLVFFISLMLKQEGILVLEFEDDPKFTQNKIADKIKSKYGFLLNGVIYVGDPNNNYFEFGDLTAIYSRLNKCEGKEGSYINSMFCYSDPEMIKKDLNVTENRTIVRKTGAPYEEKIKTIINSYCF